jgi:hypothetical protein
MAQARHECRLGTSREGRNQTTGNSAARCTAWRIVSTGPLIAGSTEYAQELQPIEGEQRDHGGQDRQQDQ